MIRVEPIDSVEAFARLQGEWDDLLTRSRAPSVFRTWAWQHAWWRHFGDEKELRIYTTRDARGGLTGIAPLCLSREGSVVLTRTLRFLGTERVSSEYLDLIVDQSHEEAAAAALLGAVRASRDWDVLALSDLPEGSVALRFWEPRFQADGFHVEHGASQEIPYLPLPATRGELRRTLTHSLRGAVSRALRKIAPSGYVYRATADPALHRPILERLFELHATRWAARKRPGKFGDERVRDFHRELVSTLGAAGAMRFGMLANGDRIIAILYSFEWRGVVSYYQAGFEPESPDPSLPSTSYSPGLALIGATVEDAVSRGMTEFDFLRGDELYKRRWTLARRRTWSVTVIRPDAWTAKARHVANGLIRSSRSRVKRLLQRTDPSAARRPRGREGSSPPRPIRVMHVIEEIPSEERDVIQIANRVPETIDASICYLRDPTDRFLSNRSSPIRILSLGRGTSRTYRLVPKLASVLRREGIDVVHSHSWRTYLTVVLAARFAGVPVVIQGYHGPTNGSAPRGREGWLLRKLSPLVTRFVASGSQAHELRERWNLTAEKVVAITDGIDVGRLDSEAKASMAMPYAEVYVASHDEWWLLKQALHRPYE